MNGNWCLLLFKWTSNWSEMTLTSHDLHSWMVVESTWFSKYSEIVEKSQISLFEVSPISFKLPVLIYFFVARKDFSFTFLSQFLISVASSWKIGGNPGGLWGEQNFLRIYFSWRSAYLFVTVFNFVKHSFVISGLNILYLFAI